MKKDRGALLAPMFFFIGRRFFCSKNRKIQGFFKKEIGAALITSGEHEKIVAVQIAFITSLVSVSKIELFPHFPAGR